MMHVVISAGPTREPLDPVRFISNRSSGKMGIALAKAARKAGHQVTLVHGPIHLPVSKTIQTISVETALQMRNAMLKASRKADLIIMAAAVADYRPQKVVHQKIKKNKNTISIRLIRNPDILAELGRKKQKKQILVGFAAETQHVIEYAQEKLRKKKTDFMVANQVGTPQSGFDVDTNRVTLIHSNGTIQKFPLLPKQTVAKSLIQIFSKAINPRSN